MINVQNDMCVLCEQPISKIKLVRLSKKIRSYDLYDKKHL